MFHEKTIILLLSPEQSSCIAESTQPNTAKWCQSGRHEAAAGSLLPRRPPAVRPSTRHTMPADTEDTLLHVARRHSTSVAARKTTASLSRQRRASAAARTHQQPRTVPGVRNCAPGARTLSVWPASVCSGTAARRSHSLTAPSWEALARCCAEDGCHASAASQSVCDTWFRTTCGVAMRCALGPVRHVRQNLQRCI